MNSVKPKEGGDEAPEDFDFKPSDASEGIDSQSEEIEAERYVSQEQVEKIRQKSQQRLQEQTKNYNTWAKVDSTHKWAEKYNFTKPDSIPSDFLYIKMLENQMINFKSITPQCSWNQLSAKSIGKYDGLKLSSKVIRFLKGINLRSQALKVELDAVLLGNSILDIALRSKYYVNEETCILRISKQELEDQQRLFFMFGFLDAKTGEFLLSRRTEIPIFKPLEQILNLSLTIIDNGNDLLCVSGIVNKNLKNTFRIVYDQLLIPIFEDFELMMASAGMHVLLRTINIEILDRLPNSEFEKRPGDTTCNACCIIF